MYNNTLPRNCEMIRKLNRYNLIKGIVGWVLAACVIAGALFMSGCAALQSTQGNLEKAAETVVAPEEFEIHYKRDGNTTHYLKRACSGEYCDNSPDKEGE